MERLYLSHLDLLQYSNTNLRTLSKYYKIDHNIPKNDLAWILAIKIMKGNKSTYRARMDPVDEDYFNISEFSKIFETMFGPPKAIILAGAAGSGKSYVVQNILGKLYENNNNELVFTPKGSNVEFFYMNPDVYIETKGMNLGTAMIEFNKVFAERQLYKDDILWDTTAANSKNTSKQLDGYDRFMVMVYTHPIISIMQNAKRERKIPLQAVLKTWNSVYENIDLYQDLFGENFVIIKNIIPGYEEEMEEFNNAADRGVDALKAYIDDLVANNPETFQSTFSQPFSFVNSELEESFEEVLIETDYNSDKDSSILKQIKKEYQKEYLKKNLIPDAKILQRKIKSIRNTKKRNDKIYDEAVEGIVDKLTSDTFEEQIDQFAIPIAEINERILLFVQDATDRMDI